MRGEEGRGFGARGCERERESGRLGGGEESERGRRRSAHTAERDKTKDIFLFCMLVRVWGAVKLNTFYMAAVPLRFGDISYNGRLLEIVHMPRSYSDRLLHWMVSRGY